MSRKDKQELGPALNNSLLLEDIRQMIEETRSAVATAVNAGLTTLYWNIGKRIHEEILKGERAEYGQEIIVSTGATIGTGIRQWIFTEKPASYDPLCRSVFLMNKLSSSLRRQLSWTHFRR